MKDLRTAESLHYEYRMLADKEIQVFSDLRTTFPLRPFPKHAARVWRLAMLAESWGTIATVLCGGKVDYVENWRTGK